jgi:hypothetical protein
LRLRLRISMETSVDENFARKRTPYKNLASIAESEQNSFAGEPFSGG